jgi:hypothetical protein
MMIGTSLQSKTGSKHFSAKKGIPMTGRNTLLHSFAASL